MSRKKQVSITAIADVPRASGDEPGAGGGALNGAIMFPARAGMSRVEPSTRSPVSDVPRASGDEPGNNRKTPKNNPCSPRERG